MSYIEVHTSVPSPHAGCLQSSECVSFSVNQRAQHTATFPPLVANAVPIPGVLFLLLFEWMNPSQCVSLCLHATFQVLVSRNVFPVCGICIIKPECHICPPWLSTPTHAFPSSTCIPQVLFVDWLVHVSLPYVSLSSCRGSSAWDLWVCALKCHCFVACYELNGL